MWSDEYLFLKSSGLSLNKLMQAKHIHDFRCKSFGTMAISSEGITTSLHQQGFLLLTMQLLIPLQKGHDSWLIGFCINSFLLS